MPVAFFAAPFAGVAGAVVFGWLCVRLSGVYLAMLTLSFAQIVWSIAQQWDSVTGGSNGLVGIWPTGWLAGRAAFFEFVLAFSAAALAFLVWIRATPFGYALRGARDSPLRAQAIGIDVRRTQWRAFALAGAFAGLAGGLYAFSKGSIAPDTLAIPRSIDGLLIVLLGGIDALAGPLLGAAAFTWLHDILTRHTEYWRSAFGCIILLLVLAFPMGIGGAAARLLDRVAAPMSQTSASLLRSRASFQVVRRRAGARRCFILRCRGGNGGVDRPQRRRQDDVLQRHQRTAPRRRRLGASRRPAYRRLAAATHRDRGRRPHVPDGDDIRFDDRSRKRAAGASCRQGGTRRADLPIGLSAPARRRRAPRTCQRGIACGPVCASLSYADVKRVELAVALAQSPRLLLMDEPAAGTSPRDRAPMMALVSAMAAERGTATLFTEHDVGVVFRFAARVIVLDRGRIIADGAPASVRADPRVRAVYLGTDG